MEPLGVFRRVTWDKGSLKGPGRVSIGGLGDLGFKALRSHRTLEIRREGWVWGLHLFSI